MLIESWPPMAWSGTSVADEELPQQTTRPSSFVTAHELRSPAASVALAAAAVSSRHIVRPSERGAEPNDVEAVAVTEKVGAAETDAVFEEVAETELVDEEVNVTGGEAVDKGVTDGENDKAPKTMTTSPPVPEEPAEPS